MKAYKKRSIAVITSAVLAALASSGHAADTPSTPFLLDTSVNSVSAGLGFSDNQGRRFGEYNGINKDGVYGLFDFSYVKRNDDTGTWLGLFGRNLGLDNRQIRAEQSQQGNWGYYVEYTRIPRLDPYTITTGVQGTGGANLVIPSTPATTGEVDLKTIRDRVAFGFEKSLTGNLDVQVRYTNETKDGARIFGRGTTGSGPPGSFGQYEFTPEPINTTTHQLDVKMNYIGSSLQLTGGYYGTMFDNHNNALNVNGGLAALSTFTPLALPPDNQSNQIYLAGNYGFTPSTNGNFKVAYARATQDNDFVTGVNVPLSPGIGTNLDGRVDTKLVQAGITSAPLPKLSLLANFRYEDRDDKTPVLFYLTPPPSTSDGANEPRSIKTTSGKAEASYSLPYAFRMTAGIDYAEWKRNTSPVRIVSYRERTDETSYRVELRRMISESVTGAIAYIHSDRGGSSWITTTQTSGALGSNLIAPITLADRKRDKVRVTTDWMATEQLTFNLFVDASHDDYNSRDGSSIGPRTGRALNASLDADYTFNDQWQANAWYSKNDTKAETTSCVGASSSGVCGSPTWDATLNNNSDTVGLGLHAKPWTKVEFGTDFTYSSIRDSYNQTALVGAPISPLPGVKTELTRANLYVKYALQDNGGVRLDYVFDRYSSTDWTWTTWMYADGTQISESQTQKVNFIGVTYYYKFK